MGAVFFKGNPGEGEAESWARCMGTRRTKGRAMVQTTPRLSRGLCAFHKVSKRSELSLGEMLSYWGCGGGGSRAERELGIHARQMMQGARCP